MKSIYQCERCGQIYETYEDCYAHEESHWNMSGWFRKYEKETAEFTVYTDKHQAPSEVGIELSRWNSNESREEYAVARYVFKEIFLEDRIRSDEERAKEENAENEENV